MLKKINSSFSIIFFFFVSLLYVNHVSGSPEMTQKWLNQLTDSKLSSEERDNISRQIVTQGTNAIPILIQHLNDPRVAGKAYWARGECINFAPHQPPPAHCSKPENVTLGSRCEELLYRILTPPYQSPHQKMVMGKEGWERPFVIRDWPIWWTKYQGKSLEELHQKAKALIDEYWKRGWNKGAINWK